MIFVNYLSTLDRERLLEIDRRVQNSTSMEERTELFAKKEEIENKRKPLHACSIEECMELAQQLYDQLQMHVRLGNRTQVKQFQSMIDGITLRTRTLYAELNKADLEKQAEVEKKKRISLDDESTDDNKTSKRSSKKRTTTNRWTISVDQFD